MQRGGVVAQQLTALWSVLLRPRGGLRGRPGPAGDGGRQGSIKEMQRG
jgi:hypothetical protein